MTESSKILLQGGTLLLHEANERVVSRRLDLLIDGNSILKIEDNIDVDDQSIKIINCDGKLVSPGFINTHHHLWQTQLKGQHGNHTLLEYLPSGNFIGSLYSPEDAFWGELSGAMEAVDAGTTSVVDHSSLNLGIEYRKKSIPFAFILSDTELRSTDFDQCPGNLWSASCVLSMCPEDDLRRRFSECNR